MMKNSKYPDMRQLMNIVIEGEEQAAEELAAISQLIADRSKEENVPSKLSTDAFITLANQMGIPLTKDTLMDMVESGKLKSVVKDINNEEIIFKGKDEIEPSEMNVDKAKEIVKKMAKRAAKKGLKND